MNTRRLRRIQRLIVKYPERFDVGSWFAERTMAMAPWIRHPIPDMSGPSCGTTACIAGWAVALYNGKEIALALVKDEAKQILDLCPTHADRLFYWDQWPRPFRKRDENAKSARERAKVAADRIDHFIKTKGAE